MVKKRDPNQVFSILYEIGKKINLTFDVDTILKYIVNATIEKFHYHNCSLLLVEGNNLVLKDGYGYDKGKFQDFKIPIGEGVTGRVAKTGKPIIINDISKIPYYITIVPGNKSEIVVPLKSRNKVIGVYSIESEQKDDFDEEDIDVMSAIADQAVIAIENARLYNSHAESIKRLSNLYDSGKAINTSLQLDEILKALIKISSKELKYDSTAIVLIKKARLYIKTGLGLSKEVMDSYNSEIGEGVCGKVAETGKPLIVNDISKFPSYIKIGEHSHTKSELAVPIKYGRTIIGVFNIESNKLNAFDENDLLFVSALAEQAAIAMKNAELYAEIGDFNKMLEKRIDIATKNLQDANKELMRLNRVKSDFVSTVSHEFRTPLTSIKGYVSLVLDEDVGQLNEQQKEFLGIVNKENERLTNLISDMLDIQKIESGKMPYNFKEFNIYDFMEDCKKEFEYLEKKNNASITTNVAENIPILYADGDKIKQVITNLVSNALKFSTLKPVVNIEVKNEREYLQMDITDNGIGITEENILKLFQKFQQIDTGSARKVGGSGLGLAICKSIIEMHGGEIGVRSKLGEGSTFSFTLPKRKTKFVRDNEINNTKINKQ